MTVPSGLAAVPGQRSAIGGPPLPAAVFVPPAAGGGADDRQAIQDAIDAAAAVGGGVVSIQDHLSIGAPLILESGVELTGTGRIGSSITALPAFAGGGLVSVAANAHHAACLSLTFDTAGLCNAIVVGAGASKIRVSGMRITGWGPANPGLSGVLIVAPPDPFGSDTPIHDVVVEGCDFDQLGNGVKISGGASHVDVLGCRFRGMRRRGIWLTGSGDLSSSHVRISGNTLGDFPLDPDLSYPIAIGGTGDEAHEYVHLSRNVIIGNGSFNGPGGLGTGDQISVHCLSHSQLVCNTSIDSAEAGIVIVDSSDVLLLGNVVRDSDGPGFLLKAKRTSCSRIQFIANSVQNNGRNRQGANLHDWVKSGFLLRDDANGVADVHLLGNYSWDDQEVKTQNYALAIAHDTVRSTLLTGNVWRAAKHGVGTVYNRGRRTKESIYESVPRIP